MLTNGIKERASEKLPVIDEVLSNWESERWQGEAL